MKFEQRSPELVSAILGSTTPGELDPVLVKLMKLYAPVLAPGAPGHKLFAKDLDDTVPHIARLLGFEDRQGLKSNENVCIVATQFFAVGGHTRIAADISRLVGGEKVSIILTDIYRNAAYRDLSAANWPALGLHYRAFLLLKSPNLVDRAIELYTILNAIKPTRIFLLNNHMDMGAVAATYPFRDITDFIHHGDHEPSLGATVPYSVHADPTHRVHLCCREDGLPAVYSSMTLPGVDLAPPEKPTHRRMRFATCGHVNKYRYPGQYRWAEWAVECLKSNDADFLHIGPYNEAFATEIRSALTAGGIAAERYIFTGQVRHLQATLARNGVDIYVASAPETGGRAILEALAARIPVIVPADPTLPPLMRLSLPLSGWVEVEHPHDVADAIVSCQAAAEHLSSAAYGRELETELGRFRDFVAGSPIMSAAG